MKTILKNSLLVSIVAGLLVLPLSGFGLFDYTKTEVSPASTVLGVQTAITSQLKIKVIDQVSLKLSISDEYVQKFYNVIPEEYLFPEFTSYAIGPKDLVDAGYLFEIADNGLSKDLIVTAPKSLSKLKSQIIELPIIIIKVEN